MCIDLAEEKARYQRLGKLAVDCLREPEYAEFDYDKNDINIVDMDLLATLCELCEPRLEVWAAAARTSSWWDYELNAIPTTGIF